MACLRCYVRGRHLAPLHVNIIGQLGVSDDRLFIELIELRWRCLLMRDLELRRVFVRRQMILFFLNELLMIITFKNIKSILPRLNRIPTDIARIVRKTVGHSVLSGELLVEIVVLLAGAHESLIELGLSRIMRTYFLHGHVVLGVVHHTRLMIAFFVIIIQQVDEITSIILIQSLSNIVEIDHLPWFLLRILLLFFLLSILFFVYFIDLYDHLLTI